MYDWPEIRSSWDRLWSLVCKLLREQKGLTQLEAGRRAWPERSKSAARANWAALESADRVVSYDALLPALKVIGLTLQVSIVVK